MKLVIQGLPQIMIMEPKKAICCISFYFLDIILMLCSLYDQTTGIALLLVKFAHAQVRVLEIGIPISKAAFIKPCIPFENLQVSQECLGISNIDLVSK